MNLRIVLAAALSCGLSLPVAAETGSAASQTAERLRDAVAALQSASSGQDQISALTQTIQAYEQGLAAIREELRQIELRESALRKHFEAERGRLSQMLAALAQMERESEPLLLFHPAGPVSTIHSGLLMAEVAPALQFETDKLKANLRQLALLKTLQTSARNTLSEGLSSIQGARDSLSRAMEDRKTPPRHITDDPEALHILIENAESLDAVAAELALNQMDNGAMQSFISGMGTLPLPVNGTLIRGPDTLGDTSARRPGMTLATPPRALVTAPWPATLRYIGPLLDYGNVVIIEPGDGYLLILAGLETMYGKIGDVIPAGAPLGLMGGDESAARESASRTDDHRPERLYLELRHGAVPADPTEWFADTATHDD